MRMFSKNGGIVWPAARDVVNQYGKDVGFNAILEVRDTLEARGVFSENRIYTDQEVQNMAEEELRSILGNFQTEEC
jgi:hypothetical protein